jgi:cytochrome c oxidase subunit III
MQKNRTENTVERDREQPIDYTGKKIGMWFFLFTELLFFGMMFLLYSVFRYRFPLEFHTAAQGENLIIGSINTAVLLTSSLLIALSLSAMKKGNRRLSSVFQVVTILFGIIFLMNKYFEWTDKIFRGIYPNSPVLLKEGKGEILFYSLYYVMTGIHALHVFIGIIVISVMVVFTLRQVITPENFAKLENTGLYWHFVDIVWIYLFPIFYLIT